MTECNKTTFSRRSMLQRSTLTATAALAAPAIIPASALGRNGFTAPSERITCGMIGFGIMMAGHFNYMLSRHDIQVLAVCDVEREKREKAQKRVEETYSQRFGSGSYKACEAYNEHELITNRNDIDVCFIITPDHWHVPMSLDAIRNGKDVYVEKPMTLTVKEGRILSDAVRRHGAILQVGSQQRSENSFGRAAEMVRNGWIGKVHTVYTWLGDFPPGKDYPAQPIPEGFDYDRWLGPTPWRPYNIERVKGCYGGGWRSFWEYGGRKNGDWGAHHYDIIQWALDMDHSGPTFFFPKGYNGSNYQGYTYENGPTILRDHPRDKTNSMIEFHGEDGIIGCGRGGQLVTFPADLKNRPLTPSDTPLATTRGHHDNFFDCVKTRKQPIAHVEIGHRTSTICHLSAISERLDRPIKWDPKTETIIDDAQANRWLDRPRRAPYSL
jgi:hypothetical protein